MDGELCSIHFVHAIAVSIIYGFDVGARSLASCFLHSHHLQGMNVVEACTLKMGVARGEGNTINKGVHEWHFEKFKLGNQAKSRQRVAITPHRGSRGSSHITSLVHSLRGHWKLFCDSLVAQHLHADDSVCT